MNALMMEDIDMPRDSALRRKSSNLSLFTQTRSISLLGSLWFGAMVFVLWLVQGQYSRCGDTCQQKIEKMLKKVCTG
jgi:hypothetical protein